LLTRVFEYFGVELHKNVGVQVIDEIDSSTLMGCGFSLVQDEVPGSEQGLQTLTPPVPRGSSRRLSLEALQQEQHQFQSELIAVKGVLVEKKEPSAQ